VRSVLASECFDFLKLLDAGVLARFQCAYWHVLSDSFTDERQAIAELIDGDPILASGMAVIPRRFPPTGQPLDVVGPALGVGLTLNL
jgi:hypothetical protein